MAQIVTWIASLGALAAVEEDGERAKRSSFVSHDSIRVDTPWTERFVHVNGITMHIAEAGSPNAPLVIFLHGFPDFFATWRFQLLGLADHFRLVAPDLRGYNLSEKPGSGYDVATLAADVRELIHVLGQREASIVGHDWGGTLAWV